MTRVDDTPVPDYLAQLRLDGRGVVLVGAGAGIGRQAAHALSQAGARVVCVDVDADLATEIAAEVDGVAWSGDATERGEIQRLVDDSYAALGEVHAVVDIIGMSRYHDLVDVSDEVWDWHVNIVLRHAQLITQLFGARLMAGGGGSLTFVASVSGITSAPRHAAYGAAKAALMSLIRTAAVEYGPRGVRTNGVAPGVVWTPRVSGYLGEEGERINAANTPLRRVAQPADIAAALLFLTSDLASYVNGQVLVVDGGVGVKFPYPMGEL
jgi:NAD(P)-dependent dehydrogenase (short-subunit alcohol dehydrogenase family)